MSVMTTSAPARASVSASSRPSPREAPVITATLPERSNGMRYLLGAKWKPGLGRCYLGQALGQDPLPFLVLRFELQLDETVALSGDAAAEGDPVPRGDHCRESAAEPAQPPVVARPADHEVGQLRHPEHPVRDHAGQPRGPRGVIVEMDRVAVPGRLCIGADLLAGDLPGVRLRLFQPRITLTIRELQIGSPPESTLVA